MLQLDPWITTLAVSLAVVLATRLIDTIISRQKHRNAAVAASKGPKVPTSWEEAYEDLTERFLKMEAELTDIKDQLAARDQAIRQQPYETAAQIFTLAEQIYTRLKARRA